jgi:hypothetical protein
VRARSTRFFWSESAEKFDPNEIVEAQMGGMALGKFSPCRLFLVTSIDWILIVVEMRLKGIGPTRIM